jgi:hypothetical protein
MCRHTLTPHLSAKVARCACRHIGAHWTTTRSSPRCALAPGTASPGLSNARLTQSRPGAPPSPARECPHPSGQRGTVTPPSPRHSAGSAPRPERHHRTAFVVSVRQLRPSASALPSAKRVHIVSAPRVSVRALERCHRRTRLASPRADGRQWTTDGQPHASLLHNAAFA